MKPQNSFDYYVRSLVTAALAVGIVGVALYEFVSGKVLSTALTGWAGLVVGVYFGQHITLNGHRSIKIFSDAPTAEPNGVKADEHV